MKIKLFVLVTLFATACGIKPSGNLPMNPALEKYRHRPGNKAFVVFPGLRENN
jgi:hypothetical protein